LNKFKSFVFMTAKQRRLCQHLAGEQPRLQRMAYSWTHDMDIADEIVQQTMIKAIRHIDSLKDFRAVDGWMFRVLSNCFYDHCRRQKDTIDIDDCVLVGEHTPDSLSDQDEMLNGVRSAIAQLPVKHRQVITLVDLESLSYLEVAEILQVPVGTVMSRLNRARKNLKELLKDEDKKADSSHRAGLKLVR
jgi:RNA polymerase sigma-70 factor (ECF subfamily)